MRLKRQTFTVLFAVGVLRIFSVMHRKKITERKRIIVLEMLRIMCEQIGCFKQLMHLCNRTEVGEQDEEKRNSAHAWPKVTPTVAKCYA